MMHLSLLIRGLYLYAIYLNFTVRFPVRQDNFELPRQTKSWRQGRQRAFGESKTGELASLGPNLASRRGPAWPALRLSLTNLRGLAWLASGLSLVGLGPNLAGFKGLNWMTFRLGLVDLQFLFGFDFVYSEVTSSCLSVGLLMLSHRPMEYFI